MRKVRLDTRRVFAFFVILFVSRRRRRRLARGEAAEVRARAPRRRRRRARVRDLFSWLMRRARVSARRRRLALFRTRLRASRARRGTRAIERVRDAADGRRRFFFASRRRRGGRKICGCGGGVSARRPGRGRRVERALEPQQTGLRVHLDLELADLLAGLAQAGLERREEPVGGRRVKRRTRRSARRRSRVADETAKPSAGLRVFLTHQELASQPGRLRLSLALHRDDDAGLRLGVRRDRRAPASVRQVSSQLRTREEGRRSGRRWVARGARPRASGGNETRRTFALCCASSWFTITSRLNVVCCGAGIVAEAGSGARARVCHGVSRMERVLRWGETHAAGLARARRTAQRNELRTM